MKKARSVAVFGVAFAAMAAVATGVSTMAQAEPANQNHYFIEIGGTCDGPANGYNHANGNLQGGEAVKVGYPATAPPACGVPMVAPSYDDSVRAGHIEANRRLQETYDRDPGGRFTIVGYSQGAHVANLVLNDIADGVVNVPKDQVNGKLYADPMQPVTGLGAVVPVGASAFGFTSPGPGRADFAGIPVQRFCIPTDGVCDFTSPEAAGGYIIQHPRYPGEFMWDTLAAEVTEPVTWLPRI